MIVRNDIGSASTKPCGAQLPGLFICGTADYESWYRAAQAIAANINNPAWVAEFEAFDNPTTVFFFPTSKTSALAAHVQRGADIMTEQGRPLPKAFEQNERVGLASGSALNNVAWGVAAGLGLAALGYFLLRKASE